MYVRNDSDNKHSSSSKALRYQAPKDKIIIKRPKGCPKRKESGGGRPTFYIKVEQKNKKTNNSNNKNVK